MLLLKDCRITFIGGRPISVATVYCLSLQETGSASTSQIGARGTTEMKTSLAQPQRIYFCAYSKQYLVLLQIRIVY